MKKVLPLLITMLCLIQWGYAQKNKITLVIHGGAGTILKKYMTPQQEKAYHSKLEEALKKGHNVLKKGGTSLDAVVTAIKILENSPLFNAGKGAVFTNQGTNELDASIMEGKTLNAGAVSSVTIVKNPITAALAVMKNSPHVMLTGKGAETFATQQGLAIVKPKYFYTKRRYEQLKRVQKNAVKGKSGSVEDLIDLNKKLGTVGAVALDQYGNIAAGTSTGGMTNKKWGRVGDTPIIGAATYANNRTCGVSATGHGEYFMRVVVAHNISALMEYKGWSVQKAAKEVVMKKLKKMGGSGGIIALDHDGNYTMTFNSAGMYRGVATPDGKVKTYIYR
ncbi:isoaspartyl peptidase/L-asparaginase family protein [uncultured Microscilla sp.]|uniref:isoaspartyl peptidase/L-asparaginase family protein n=1 Tax=uncultured Microscilla sp. TaxID=432653 RepID=UPI0026158B3D|nr:isoaspartyl peptidase/L-asparaginase [uncultured Microscilla sp.]